MSALQQLHGAVEEVLTRLIFSNDNNTTTLNNANKHYNKNNNGTASSSSAAASVAQLLQKNCMNHDDDVDDGTVTPPNSADPSVPLQPVIPVANRVAWWTHRALTDVAVVEAESTQITALAIHLVTNHQNSVVAAPSSKQQRPILSALCGSDQLAAQLRSKLRQEAASSPQLQLLDPAAGYVKVRTIEEAAIEADNNTSINGSNNNNNQLMQQQQQRPLCSVFAFGGFPATAKSRRMEPFHCGIASHVRSGTEYSFILGHFFWPDCDGPMKLALNRSRSKLLEVKLSVATAAVSSSSSSSFALYNTVEVPQSTLFSPCFAMRCARHSDQVSLLTSAMTLQEMKVALRCNRLCRLPLRCGNDKHLCTDRCHTLAEHNETPCGFPCGNKVPGCDHVCRMLCGEVCDCLKRTKRDLECGHVTLKGQYVRHRFEGSCAQSHSHRCLISVPVRCAQCYGVSHVPCCEVTESIRQKRTMVNNSNDDDNNDDGAQAAAVVNDDDGDKKDDIPTMPADTYRCQECRDAEFRVRSQVKFELQREAEDEKRQSRLDAERHLKEQQKAATKGIFQMGAQTVISDAQSILDPDLAAALFGDSAAGLTWIRFHAGISQQEDLANVVGTVVARQSDPTDPDIFLYILSLPTHNGHVAVPDTGLALVRAVFKSDAEHNLPLLMLENRKRPAGATATTTSGAAAATEQESGLQKHLASLEQGTRVVVLKGEIPTKDLPDYLIDVFFDHHQQMLFQQAQQASSGASFDSLFSDDDEDDFEEEGGAGGETATATSSMKNEDNDAIVKTNNCNNNNNNNNSSSSDNRRKNLPEVITINNVIGTVYSYVKSEDSTVNGDATSISASSATVALVWVDLRAYFQKQKQEQQQQQNSDANQDPATGSRRDRDGGAAVEGASSTNSSNHHHHNAEEIASEELLVEVRAEPRALVPLFASGTIVRVREATRHVLDPLERERFGVKQHHFGGGSGSNRRNAASPEGAMTQQQKCSASASLLSSSGSGGSNHSSNPAASPSSIFIPHQLPREARCTVQGFVNAPKASHGAVTQDVILRSASRRGPCYLVSMVGVGSNNNNNNNKTASASAPSRVALVPVFFVDLDTDEIADQAVARKIKEELELRCSERMEAAVEERYLSNREADAKRRAAVAEMKRAREKKQQQVSTTAPQLFITARILLSDATEREASQRYLAAKRFALGSHAAMLQRDATAAASESVNVQQLTQAFIREKGVDDQTRPVMLRRVQ